MITLKKAKLMEKLNWNLFEEEALSKLHQGASLEGKDGVMAPLIKHLLEAALEGELDVHLAKEKAANRPNRRNGKGKKRVKTGVGKIELETSRDRGGSFEPVIVKKRQRTLGDGLEKQILSMYSRGMSYSDIQLHFESMYGLELSKGQISTITDRVWEEITEWQNRRLEKVYAIVWMDALHFKVRVEGKIVSRAMYVVLGLDEDGKKDLLSLHISENEGAKFWLQVLTDLQNRGVEDILIACIDNLSGFSEAISSIYPRTEVQLCIVHQIRNSKKYVTRKDSSSFMSDLRKVYQASQLKTAEKALDALEEKWGEKYGVIIRSWRNNWDELSGYFQYSDNIRTMIYTTNIVEGFNRQIRKVTKSKGVFPSEDGLMKLVWLAARNVSSKWTRPVQNWNLTAQQLYIHFPNRFNLKLKM